MAANTGAARARSGEPQPVTGCFVRLGWIVGANVLLAALAILIARGERWTLTAKDAAFWLLVPSAMSLRYLDWKRFSGMTASGEPTRLHDFRRYVALLLGGWSALWALGQSLELG